MPYGKRYACGAICRELRGVRIYTRVLSTTFAIGEHIADEQRLSISHLRSKYIAFILNAYFKMNISRERSEPTRPQAIQILTDLRYLPGGKRYAFAILVADEICKTAICRELRGVRIYKERTFHHIRQRRIYR